MVERTAHRNASNSGRHSWLGRQVEARRGRKLSQADFDQHPWRCDELSKQLSRPRPALSRHLRQSDPPPHVRFRGQRTTDVRLPHRSRRRDRKSDEATRNQREQAQGSLLRSALSDNSQHRRSHHGRGSRIQCRKSVSAELGRAECFRDGVLGVPAESWLQPHGHLSGR